jgi:hypothetical protein
MNNVKRTRKADFAVKLIAVCVHCEDTLKSYLQIAGLIIKPEGRRDEIRKKGMRGGQEGRNLNTDVIVKTQRPVVYGL